MPIPIPATTYYCPCCHWQKTVMPDSDRLIVNHTIFYLCPKCGNSQLISQAANGPQIIFTRLANALAKILR